MKEEGRRAAAAAAVTTAPTASNATHVDDAVPFATYHYTPKSDESHPPLHPKVKEYILSAGDMGGMSRSGGGGEDATRKSPTQCANSATIDEEDEDDLDGIDLDALEAQAVVGGGAVAAISARIDSSTDGAGNPEATMPRNTKTMRRQNAGVFGDTLAQGKGGGQSADTNAGARIDDGLLTERRLCVSLEPPFGVCFNFWKSGQCQVGAQCKFKHQHGDVTGAGACAASTQMPAAAKTPALELPMGVCFTFWKSGQCAFSATCKYKHEQPAVAALAAEVQESKGRAEELQALLDAERRRAAEAETKLKEREKLLKEAQRKPADKVLADKQQFAQGGVTLWGGGGTSDSVCIEIVDSEDETEEIETRVRPTVADGSDEKTVRKRRQDIPGTLDVAGETDDRSAKSGGACASAAANTSFPHFIYEL